MILQINEKLKSEIKQWGCYFMSLLFLVNKLTNMSLPIGRINTLYRLFVSQGWMTETCFIQNPTAILGWAGIKAQMVFVDGTHRVRPDYECLPNEYEILCFSREGAAPRTHFVVGDGSGHVAYDPYGESLAVKEGELVSKRVFRVFDVASGRAA